MTDDKSTRNKLIDMKRQLTPRDLYEAELKAKFTKKPAEVKKFKGRMARLKGMMTQWEPFQQAIDNYIARKTRESKNLPEKIARLKKVVKDECAHPIEDLEVIEEYVSGSYYDTAYTEYFVKCKLCGKTEKMEHKSHSWYG